MQNCGRIHHGPKTVTSSARCGWPHVPQPCPLPPSLSKQRKISNYAHCSLHTTLA